MVPHLNSVVFYYKTTTWSCLSWTTCSRVCSRTSSCFGACYRSSFPENLATSSHWFVLQTFFSRHVVWIILLPTRFESQADMMVGTSSKNYDIGSSEVDAPSWKHYYCSILIKPFGYFPWGFHMTYPTSCSLWIFVFPKSDLLLDVLDIKPYLWMDYASTSRRTLEVEC